MESLWTMVDLFVILFLVAVVGFSSAIIFEAYRRRNNHEYVQLIYFEKHAVIYSISHCDLLL